MFDCRNWKRRRKFDFSEIEAGVLERHAVDESSLKLSQVADQPNGRLFARVDAANSQEFIWCQLVLRSDAGTMAAQNQHGGRSEKTRPVVSIPSKRIGRRREIRPLRRTLLLIVGQLPAIPDIGR